MNLLYWFESIRTPAVTAVLEKITYCGGELVLGSLTVEERRNLPLALVGLIFLHFYPCYCVDTICPNIV